MRVPGEAGKPHAHQGHRAGVEEAGRSPEGTSPPGSKGVKAGPVQGERAQGASRVCF